jgi:hypothetical protein
MHRNFQVYQINDWININVLSPLSFYSFSFYVDGQLVGTFSEGRAFNLDRKRLHSGNHLLYIIGHYVNFGVVQQVQEGFVIHVPKKYKTTLRGREAEFKPGDILVACDNVNGLPPGYMGHSVIVIDDQDVIESVTINPSIRQDTIAQFLEAHPLHAHYRPKSEELGQKAALYAQEYLAKYQENLEQGIERPEFSFWPQDSLDDLWGTIYCSKLVWLCYYYGAGYFFQPEGLWFSPQNLDEVLESDDNFELLYKHPEFNFYIAL